MLKLLPPGLATWHGCFTEVFFWFFGFLKIFLGFFFCFFFKSMFAPTQIWVGLHGQTRNQFDEMADF